MSRNNDVFKVLVTKGNAAVLAKDNGLSDLAPNQIGVFDANTNLSVDATSTLKPREFYLAIGLDRDGDGNVDDIVKSAGQMIQRDNVRFYSLRPHTAAQPMIVEISDYVANCDTDYTVKLELRNQKIYRRQGFVPFTKSYSVRTSCCDGCEGCPSGDCNELSLLLKDAINADVDNLASAKVLASQALTAATHGVAADLAEGDEVSDSDIQALITFNSTADDADKVCTKIQITTEPLAVRSYCNVNNQYFNPRGTFVIVSLVGGFDCTGQVTTTQELAFEEGNGYDIKQLEYEAGGWDGNPGPYRVNTLTNLSQNIEYFADADEEYLQLALTYDQFSIAGWLEHLNNLSTIVAIPETSTTTRDGLVAILDWILAGTFDALADDAAAANVDPTVVESTEDKDDVDEDGIG